MNKATTDLKWLIGDSISSAKLDAETGTWLLALKSGATLQIECMWRLLEGERVSSTSFDHGHLFGHAKEFDGISALEELAQYPIVAVDVRPEVGDLNLKLDKSFSLQIIATSAGYEPWQITHASLGTFVASGGEIHHFDA